MWPIHHYPAQSRWEFLEPYGPPPVNSPGKDCNQNLKKCCCSRVSAPVWFFTASLQTLAACEEQSEVKPFQNRWLKSAQLKGVNTFFILPGTLSSICFLQKAQSDRRVKPRMSSALVNTLLLRVNLCLYFLYAGPYVHRRRKPRTENV